MPEISRFFGIVIRMFMEVGEPHHRPHFHAYYQNAVGILAIDPVELIAGAYPESSAGWLRRGRNCIKMNWKTIGASYRKVDFRSQSSR